jgi:hypothetical protein
MAKFRITAPDGTVYNVTGDDAQGAYDAVQQMHAQKAQPGEGVSADPNPPLLPGERPLTVGPGRAAAGTEPELSVGESAVRGARSGATFNWGDELAGLSAASPIPGQSGQPDVNAIDTILGALRLGAENVAPSVFGQAGHQAQQAMAEKVRAENAAAQEAHPNAYLGGELGGGVASAAVAPMLTPFKVAPAANVVARAIPAAANLALTGGVYGGVAGAGGAEGGIGDRATGAASGAYGGAVLGPIVGGAANMASGIGRGAANQVRAFTNPTAIADRLIAAVTGHQGDAADLPAIIQRMRDAQAQGQQLTLGDVAGPNTQALAGQVLRNPGEARGPAREFVTGRQEGTDPFTPNAADTQGARVTQSAGNVLSHQGLIDTTDNLIAKRAADSQPLYEAAHIKPINYDTNEGQQLLAALDRIPPQAKNNANRLLAVSNEGGNQVIWKKMQDGIFQMVPVPNTRRFDYIKRGLDDLIEKQRGKTGRYNEYGRALIRLKNEILGHLDNLVPEYKAARDMFAGHSELLDAMKEGKDIWAPGYTPEKLAKTLQGMSDGEKKMMGVGAADALLNVKLENMPAGADKVKAIFGRPAMVKKIRMIAPDRKSFDTLKTFLENEQGMFKTYAQMGGSPTAERLKQDEATERIMGAGRMAASAAMGHWRAFTYEAFRNLARISPERRSAVMEAVRKVVLNPDPAAVENFMNKVNSSATPSNARQFISTVVNTLPRTAITDTSAKQREAH